MFNFIDNDTLALGFIFLLGILSIVYSLPELGSACIGGIVGYLGAKKLG